MRSIKERANYKHALVLLVGAVLALAFFWHESAKIDTAEAKVSGAGQLKIKQISSGSTHTCAIASDNKAYCWGDGTNGQLGNGTNTASQTTPVAVSQGAMPAGATFRQIAAGNLHTCAIASDNKAYCWGDGASGKLGNGLLDNQSTPVAVSQGAMPSGATIRQIASGNNFSCAIASDNKAYCWGSGANGKLGNGTTSTSQTTPSAVSQGAMPAGATVRQISTASFHACAIASDNKAYCWGAASSGRLGNGTTTPEQTTPVAVSQGAMPVGATIKQITTGNTTSCAIASDDKAYCWGSGTAGRLGNGSTSQQTTPVAVSQGTMPSGASIRQIDLTAASTYTCAIASDNKAYCWGDGTNGELGNGTNTASQSTPVAVSQGAMPSGATIYQVASSGDHTCAIASDHKAYCWGAATSGRLGNGTTTPDQNTPVAVSAISQQVEVSQSVYRAYGPSASTSPGSPLAAENAAATLGSIASDFRIRIGLTNLESSSVQLKTDTVVSGNAHTCAIASDNKAYCWGESTYGQLGNGVGNGSTATSQTTPVAVSQGAMPSGATILQITAGNYHTCVIASDHKAYCWGYDGVGQLGDSTVALVQNTPVAVAQGSMPLGSTILQVVAGNLHSCAIASDNNAYCWGNGSNGELGNTATSQQNTPVAVSLGAMPSSATIQLTAGSNHTCAIASDNKAYCWGQGTYGQLGNNTTPATQTTPVAVSLGTMPSGATIRHITANIYHTCAIASDNKAYCWGYGIYGMLGDGANAQQNTPVTVLQGAMPASATIQQISAGNTHTCAIASDNKAYCWGYSTNGQLGDGVTTSFTNTPVAVVLGAMPSGTTIKQIEAGSTHTCAVASDNKAYCWGAAANGRLGNGTTTPDQTSSVATSSGAMVGTGTSIDASQLDLDLQVAPLGVESTCTTVSTGWANVSATSVMNWGSAPPSHSTAIASFGSDPTAPTAGGYSYQSIVQSGSFTNSQAIAPQQTGLWDFVLHDRSSKSATGYCLRVVSNTAGSVVDSYTHYPYIITAPGSMSVQFVDNGGTPLISADTDFSPISRNSSVQVTTATLLDSSNKQLQAHNSTSSSGWSIALAATGGPTASWVSGGDSYSYNASSSSNGQLSVNMSSSSLAANGTDPTNAACSTTGLTNGSGTVTYSNLVSAITLLTGSPSSQFNCNWRLQAITLSQTIPSMQSAGSYSLDMTATIVAN